MDTQIPQEGAVEPGEAGGRPDNTEPGGAHGRSRDGGGDALPRPHPHMPADRAEAQCQQGGRQDQGAQLDNAVRAAPRVAGSDRQGSHVLGTRLLREHSRLERGGDTQLHQEPGGRQQGRVGRSPLWGPGR